MVTKEKTIKYNCKHLQALGFETVKKKESRHFRYFVNRKVQPNSTEQNAGDVHGKFWYTTGFAFNLHVIEMNF